MKKVFVIGGSNIDYLATSFDELKEHNSNPGFLRINYGGVARNIVENLARLENKVDFLTVIGCDQAGKGLLLELENLRVNVILPKEEVLYSSSYVALCDNFGDMHMAICDASCLDKLTPELIASNDELIENADFLVIDANISKEAIDYIFKHYSHKKIISDGISESKVIKFIPYLDKFFILKINNYEYDIIKQELENKMPKHLIVSCGSESVKYYENKKITYVEVKKQKVVNATGAGDALTSGIVHHLLNLDCKEYSKEEIVKAIETGIRLASFTLDAFGPCNKLLTLDLLK